MTREQSQKTTAQNRQTIPILGDDEVLVDPLDGTPGSFTVERQYRDRDGRRWSSWTVRVDERGIPMCEECGGSEWDTKSSGVGSGNPICVECGFMPRQRFRTQLKAALDNDD